MSRKSRYDEDLRRLPKGMKRVGYNSNSQRYTFQDQEDGTFWEGPEGASFGKLVQSLYTDSFPHLPPYPPHIPILHLSFHFPNNSPQSAQTKSKPTLPSKTSSPKTEVANHPRCQQQRRYPMYPQPPISKISSRKSITQAAI